MFFALFSKNHCGTPKSDCGFGLKSDEKYIRKHLSHRKYNILSNFNC